jgi:ABC-type multidrug transport system fused ATPase/permease subunit
MNFGTIIQIITQAICRKGIFSHETALYFHDLCDRTPIKYQLTIPSYYNTKLLLEEIQSSSMSLTRINKLLKEQGKEDITAGEAVPNLKGKIEFENVCMQYGENQVLHNISFTIKEGNKVTIAGKTGVGKTTIANLLMRLYPITSGKIKIGDKNIEKIRIEDIRKNISYISQTPYLLNDTLKNNITLGEETITNEQIETAAEEIGFKKVFDKFKKGLDQNIEKNQLSYGEL